MSIDVPFLPDSRIEANAEQLLMEYTHSVRPIRCPPVPVEDILEKYLKLNLDIDDLCAMFSMRDVLGALFVNKKTVFVDQRLDPSIHPEMEGRYRFTLGHEIGHWCQHRSVINNNPNQTRLFPRDGKSPLVVCRTSVRKIRIEQQADRFSACLLMPANMINDAWRTCFNNYKPICYDERITTRYDLNRRKSHPVRVGAILANMAKSPQERFQLNVARQFARNFKVSAQAMRFRLLNLGLLKENPNSEIPDMFSQWG